MSDIPAFPTGATSGGSDIPAFPGGGVAPGDATDAAYQAYMDKRQPGWRKADAAGDKKAKDIPGHLFDIDALGKKKAEGVKAVVSGVDLTASIPAMIMGTGADFLTRGTMETDKSSHKEAAAAGNKSYEAINTAIGSPFHKLLTWAGIGSSTDDSSGIDKLMGKVESLLGEGGDSVEKKTGGVILADDVKSIAHAAMAVAGGKGLKAGLTKLATRAPGATLDALSKGPEAEQARAIKAVQDSPEPLAARQHAEQGAAIAEQAVEAKTRIKEPKEFVLDPTTGELSEKIPEMGKGLPKATSEETGLEKAASGRRWGMTAEERIAMKGLMDKPLEKPIVGEDGEVLDKEALAKTPYGARRSYRSGERGAIDSEMLGVGAIARGIQKLSTMDLTKLDPRTAIGPIIEGSKYTFKTLGRLPQNKSEFAKSFIEQELKRGDVTDMEKGVLQAALAGAPGDKITAKDLMLRVRKATGDFELTPEKTDDFASYGIDSIGRKAADMRDDDWGTPTEEESKGEVPAETTMYRLPEGMDVGDNNHFGDKRLFGWTRSFKEDGVRHVVEIQSDLAQRAGKTLGEEERDRLTDSVSKVNAQLHIFNRNHGSVTDADWWAKTKDFVDDLVRLNEDVKYKLGDRVYTQWAKDFDSPEEAFDHVMEKAKTDVSWRKSINAALVDYQKQLKVLREESTSKLRESGSLEKVTPILKNWPKRLIREELGDAADAGETSVKFATAETVAKVEGWPEKATRPESIRRQIAGHESSLRYYGDADKATVLKQIEDLKAQLTEAEKNPGSKFSPEHQSIFDRYKRDIEKFLKQQGGKAVTDEKGHEWLEVPTPRRYSSREMGSIDPKLMARLAAMGLGATAGLYFSDDKSFMDAALGAGVALGATLIPYKKAISTFKMLVSKDTRLEIKDLADAQEKFTKLGAVEVWSRQQKLEKLAPKAVDREAITHAIESGDLSKLTPNQRAAAKIATDYFKEMGEIASLEGVLHAARENYVTHLWDWSANKGLFEKFIGGEGGSGGMSPNNRFAQERSVPTIAAGKAAGLKPLTEDISVIMGIYGNSMSRSIANSVFTRALKNEKVPGTGVSLVMAADNAPHSYVGINNSLLHGLRVHPDIAPSLKMLYDTSSPGMAMKVLMGISDSSKKIAVNFSLFHAKALMDAAVAGGSNPFKTLAQIPSLLTGENKFLGELKKGAASALVDEAAEGGLMFSLEHGESVVEDSGNGFYAAMGFLQKSMDDIIPHSGIAFKGAAEVSKAIDKIMWPRLHAGWKLMLFAEKRARLLDNVARKAKGGKAISMTGEQASRIAASFTNDIFGGLNWRRVAEDSQSRLGRAVGQALLNPGARRIAGLLMFAPDWTLSTTRAMVKAFGGRPDFISPTTLAGLHQQYLIRAAVYYAVVGGSINYAMSGHHFWENKDPTVLDMDPKGETHMQWSKHSMEPVHWITKTRQQAMNKLGVLPREALEQLFNMDYLSASGKAPPIQNRATHLAKNFLPISAQSADQGGIGGVVGGMLGTPIYGLTAAEKKKLREERKRQKRLAGKK